MPRSSRRRSSATQEEKQALRDGRIPEDWKDKPAKLAQKDCDARWTIKYTKAKPKEDGVPQVDLAIPAFGYKNHGWMPPFAQVGFRTVWSCDRVRSCIRPSNAVFVDRWPVWRCADLEQITSASF